jgi:hypothetical protein
MSERFTYADREMARAGNTPDLPLLFEIRSQVL